MSQQYDIYCNFPCKLPIRHIRNTSVGHTAAPTATKIQLHCRYLIVVVLLRILTLVIYVDGWLNGRLTFLHCIALVWFGLVWLPLLTTTKTTTTTTTAISISPANTKVQLRTASPSARFRHRRRLVVFVSSLKLCHHRLRVVTIKIEKFLFEFSW